MADIWVDCWAELQATTDALAEWDCVTFSGISNDTVINVLELGDPKTDPVLGWEKFSTIKGLIKNGKIPKGDSLSESDLLALFDDVLSREASILHGRPSISIPYNCVLFSDKLSELCGNNDALKAFYTATIAAYGLYNTIIARSTTFFEYPDEISEPSPSVISIISTVEVADAIAALDKAIATAKNDKIKTRLELRRAILVSLNFKPKNLRESAAAMGAVSSLIRKQVLPTLAPAADMAKMAALYFPKDSAYWETAGVATSSSIVMPDNTVEFLAKLFEVSAEAFTRMDGVRTIFDLISAAEYFGAQTPILVRGVVMILLLEEDGSFANGPALDARVINHISKELGAPLYEQMIQKNPAASNTSLSDVAHYYTNSLKPDAKDEILKGASNIKALQSQLAYSVQRFISHITHIVETLVSGALRHPASFHRILMNNMATIGECLITVSQFEKGVLRVDAPAGSSEVEKQQLSEYIGMASVLSLFVSEIAFDAMERYIRLTVTLGLPATNEYPAMMWYLQQIVLQRQDCIYAMYMRHQGKAPAIPERRVNKRTGVPLFAPALTSRIPMALPQEVALRLQLVSILAEASASALTSLCRAGVVRGSKASEYLVPIGSTFDHRFQCFLQTRAFNCPGYQNYERRFDSILAGRSTYQILTASSNVSESVAKAAANGHHEMLNTNQPLAAETFQTIRKSALALSINLATIRDKICADEANVASNAEKEVVDPVQLLSPEQLQQNLGDSKIIMATKDYIIAVPTMI